MATFHVTLEASVPDPLLATLDEESELRARSALLTHGWYERRTINWRLQSRPIDHNGQSQTRHQVRLDLDCPRIARPKSASFCLHLNVVTSREDDPCDKARRILDLPGAPRRCGRSVIHPGSLDRGSFARIRSNSVIGPVPDGWPVDRLLTRYAHHLGSYGQGGVGLSGWQLNGGSWLVLPLKYSDSYIWLTFEDPMPAADHFPLRCNSVGFRSRGRQWVAALALRYERPPASTCPGRLGETAQSPRRRVRRGGVPTHPRLLPRRLTSSAPGGPVR